MVDVLIIVESESFVWNLWMQDLLKVLLLIHNRFRSLFLSPHGIESHHDRLTPIWLKYHGLHMSLIISVRFSSRRFLTAWVFKMAPIFLPWVYTQMIPKIAWDIFIIIFSDMLQAILKATSIPPNKQFCLLVQIAWKDQLYFVIAYQNHIPFQCIYGFGMVQCRITCQFKMIRSCNKWLHRAMLVP